MANLNGFRDRAKSLWLKGMKVVGNTAANIASNTKYKVDEMTIQNRRREVLNDLADKTYGLWLKGEKVPEPLVKLLSELQQLDNSLNDMRAERFAYAELKDTAGGETDTPETAEDEDAGDGDEEDKQEFVSPVSTEINEYFDESSSVGKMAKKINSSLEQMSDRVKSFPSTDRESEGDNRINSTETEKE